MGHADEMLENAPKLKRKLKANKQYNEVQKSIDNLALTVIELIRTVEAMKTVMDNRKSTCNCNKSVDKDADTAKESSCDCKLESRRDALNKELHERFFYDSHRCMTCKHVMEFHIPFSICTVCFGYSNYESLDK